ncbi:glycerol uptake facilitator-like aquaporin [Aeromicrobium panaciterrae]|uniref:Glycerol uptake facilitator-like aquaporin n=1 Tax=Aeromicrobium panaciterrae TaxID=363861 RepID=A0ABU1UL22_9ACTN|nr:MIP/aquaporin family protein [Aeromicrobium panaciterrae]MDR7085849.1 glycerol uptake facilitator-like aquaporin [Aeromicrobium panaciterrae]
MRLLLNSRRAVFAEFVGTAILIMAVVGSGIAAQRLTADIGLQLLINAVATVLALGVLIALFLPISGAHFNPVVSAVMLVRRDLSVGLAGAYVVAQVAGGALGTLISHAMYDRSLVSTFDGDRSEAGLWLGEIIATAGLVLVVLLASREVVAVAVPAWIGAAYFFTSSTSFANPAVTIARALTDSFSGIRWEDVPWFVLAQLLGGAIAIVLARSLKEMP